MFTGIVSAVAPISVLESHNNELLIKLTTPYSDVTLGESIAVNGTCLTVAKLEKDSNGTHVEFYASTETTSRTNLGDLKVDDFVNLERALLATDRLSGHLVQGHVDGLAKLAAIKTVGDCFELEVELPSTMLKYVVEKGSIALDGISLTVNSVKNSKIYLMIIPHTWAHTSLKTKRVGQNFNVELDVIAKYVERLSQAALKA